MTREEEDKIIAQVQGILEKRIAVQTDIKINLQNLAYYSAYYQGALPQGWRDELPTYQGGQWGGDLETAIAEIYENKRSSKSDVPSVQHNV